MPAPKNIAAQIAAREARLKEMLAEEQAKLERLRERLLKQAADFVRKAAADGLEPEVLMGLLLAGVEAAKHPATAEEYRRRGEAHFRRASRKNPKIVEPAGGGESAPPFAGAA